MAEISDYTTTFSYCLDDHFDRLPTTDRLISWGIETNGTCCLCQMEFETMDHIFFIVALLNENLRDNFISLWFE